MEKVKIIKIALSLVLAMVVSVFIGEKVFFPSTMVINPRVKKTVASSPENLRQSFLNLAGLIKRFIPGQQILEPPPLPNQPPGTFFPTATYSLEPTSPGYNPPISSPYYPAATATPRPTGGQTPNPTSTPIPTATPIAPTPTTSSITVETFAKCLTQRGMKIYGRDGCGSCQAQKNLFGAAFSYITYINCSSQAQICQSRGISGYPTWEDGSGNLQPPGFKNFNSLSQISGCPAPS